MYYLDTSVFVSKILFSLGILNTGFPLVMPLCTILHPGFIKSHKTDPKYLNFCLAAGGIRILVWACCPFGLRDHLAILFMNVFGIMVYALIESKSKRIASEYFKY